MPTVVSRRLHWSVALSLLLMLAAAVVAAAPAHADTEARAHELRFVDSLNVERATRDRDRLVVADDLTQVAREHSARMARESRLHHNPNLGTDVTGWKRVGENVGRGGSVSSIHTALMNSEGHRANMLDTRFTEVGIGVAVSGSTIWVTQVFRLPHELTGASFRDVSGGSHATNIVRLYEAGITTGCTSRDYCPADAVTRAQMATFLARSAALMPSSSDPFADLDRAPLHRANVSALADHGITGGCDEHNYCPGQRVNRGQMATFLANALGLQPVSGARFDDVDPANPHSEAINAIADAGITLGCGDGNYCPTQRVTRAEMASFLVRAFDL